MLRFHFNHVRHISIKWNIIILPIILDASHFGAVEGMCQASSNDLSLQNSRGQIPTTNHPTVLVRDQHCKWTFPNGNYPGRSLLIFVDQVDLISHSSNGARKVVGDIRIGGGEMFWTMPRANCKLFGKNLSNVDMKKLLAYVKTMLEGFDHICSAWYFDSRMPEDVTFRVDKDKTSAELLGRKFLLRYYYIDVTLHVEDQFSPSVTTMSTSIPIEVTDGKSQKSESRDCRENSTEILVLAIVTVVLIGLNVLLGFLLWRKHRGTKKGSPSQRLEHESSSPQGHVNESSYASILDQAAPYATVPSQGYSTHLNSDAAHYSSVTEPPPPNQVMYDVPTNNRLRTPTVHSSHSVAEEVEYQAPSSLAAIEEKVRQEAAQPGKVKDVYAVVDKKKKMSLE